MRTQDQIPEYLKTYCIEHDTSKYTARDHASWRYIMNRAVPFFRQHAVRGYEEGLAATGISLDRIPHIDDMDKALQKFGWGAVPVCGFIPPWAFLEFQARKILPIATDMRTVDHIAYTPAPDIVHEAAGHAPILPDLDYSNYLAHYAQLGTKAIYSKQDLQLYEAVRYLSDIKEKPESTKEQIDDAELRLQAAVKAFTYVSEAAKVGRMSWWTAEYGMAGSLDEPKIYGAGLLSSVGESKDAYGDAVKKIPLSLACTEYAFNITEPQPQLFVAEDMQHLHDVLHQLDETLSYRTGGLSSVKKAVESEAVTTTVLDSGLEVSGIMTEYLADDDQPIFVKYTGPVQFCYQGVELEGQGIQHHSQGFSSPLGRLEGLGHTPLCQAKDHELESFGIEKGRSCQLKFRSGFVLKGQLEGIVRKDGKILYMSFTNCNVSRGGETYYQPDWGPFDLAVGEEITGIYGGPADREAYGEHEIIQTETQPGRSIPYSNEELELFTQYQSLRDLRQANASQVRDKLLPMTQKALSQHPGEWLLLLEILELAKGNGLSDESVMQQLSQHLDQDSHFSPQDQKLLQVGLQLLQ